MSRLGEFQLGELLSRLVGPNGTRGLSGDADRVLPQDPSLAFYNDRLRRHRAADDLVADPAQLWRAGGRRAGLEAHLAASLGDGLARWSDLLVVVNAPDWARSLGRLDQPWTEQVAALLRGRFERFCVENDMHRVFPQRPMGVKAVMDGGAELRGGRLHLGPGEFVTGLLPNFYGGVGASSRPVVAVHVHIPGAWEGYREVGRLYSDQVLFTLGSHWLDNFQHPALRAPALYRLQQLSDGSFVHLISPDLAEQVHVRREAEAGAASVLTLAATTGETLAHLVLVEVDPVRDPIFMEDTQSLGGAPDPFKASATFVGPVKAPQATGGLQSRTVVPVEVEERILTLHERGVLLQRVHFSRFMLGYDVYIGAAGEIGTAMSDPAATLSVRGAELELLVHHANLRVDGDPVPPGSAVRLRGDHRVAVDRHTLAFRDLRGVDQPGWPYLAELRRPGATLHLVFGARHKVGREPRCAVRLPDEPHNGNLVWRPDLSAGDTIRSRNGEISKARFYLDSIMVASEHAEIDLRREPVVYGLARDCYTFVRRAGQLLPLPPTRGSLGDAPPPNLDLLPDDELLVGNCVLSVSYPPSSGISADGDPVGAYAPPLSAAELAAAMDELDDSALNAAAPLALPRLGKAPGPTDPPTARGLGERGPAPARPALAPADPGPAPLMMLDEPPPAVAPPPRRGEDWLDDEPADGILEAAARQPADAADLPAGPPPPVALPLPPGLAREDSLVGATAAPEAPVAPPGPPRPRGVQVVDEEGWKLELGRPARLRLVGWMVAGEVTIGNHDEAAVCVPENRAEPEQSFGRVDYLRVSLRGRSGRLTLLSQGEAALYQGDQRIDQSLTPDACRIEVIRRDPFGQEDFRVVMAVVDDPSLPDPRARLLSISDRDLMVGALFTAGLPLRAARRLRLGTVELTALFDGQQLQLSGYLPDYRTPGGGYRALFAQQGGRPFRTLPEDGAPLRLAPGDRLLLDGALWVFSTDGARG